MAGDCVGHVTLRADGHVVSAKDASKVDCTDSDAQCKVLGQGKPDLSRLIPGKGGSCADFPSTDFVLKGGYPAGAPTKTILCLQRLPSRDHTRW